MISLTIAAGLAAFQGEGLPPEMRDALDAAVAALRQIPEGGGSPDKERIRSGAAALAKRFKEEAVEPLARIVASLERAPSYRDVSATALAFLLPDPGAEKALLQLAGSELGFVRQSVLDALLCVGVGASRPLLKDLAAGAHPPDVRLVAFETLCSTGDPSLKEFLAGTAAGADARLRASFQAWLSVFDQAAGIQDAERRDRWTKAVLDYSYGVREASAAISSLAGAGPVAWRLATDHPEFPVDFLRLRIRSGDVLAPLLLGRLRKTEAIDDLRGWAGKEGEFAEAARQGLSMMGSGDALRALEAALTPDAPATVSRHLAMNLAGAGDAQSLKVLRDAASNEAFGADTQASLRQASERLGRRLEKK